MTEPKAIQFQLLKLSPQALAEAKRVLQAQAKRQASGYAAMPGTGPAGETCKSCRHRVARQYAKAYWKCRLMAAAWTHGRSTDIRLKSPACRRWEAPEAIDAPA